jgi:hypothetical protein
MQRANLGRGPRQPTSARVALRKPLCWNHGDRSNSRCQRHRENCGEHESAGAPNAPIWLNRAVVHVRQRDRQAKPDRNDCQKHLSGQKREGDGNGGPS